MDLRTYATYWGRVAEGNLAALGDAWDLANEFVRLHVVATDRLATQVRENESTGTVSKSDESSMLLACHGLNLFSDIMIHIVRGLFDVSALQMRALFDTQSLLHACASHEDQAERFLNGKLEAAESRKLLVGTLRSSGSSMAEVINSRYNDERKAANLLAHVGDIHARKTVNVTSTGMTPTIWGRIDPQEAMRQARGALEHEFWLLSWIKGFKPAVASTEWTSQLDALAPRLRAFMQ